MFQRVWTWIKAHSLWVFAAALGAIAAYYLIFRPGSTSSGGTTAITYPASTGGGGGGGSDGGGTATATPTAPYAPDYSTLADISDALLRGLQEKVLNLQTQINAATLAGNTSLANSLTTSLNSLLGQIAAYKARPGTNDNPIPAGLAASLLQSARAWAVRVTGDATSANWRTLLSTPEGKQKIFDFYRQFFAGFGIPAQYADYVYTKLNNYVIGTGLDPTTAMIEQWIREAYAGFDIPAFTPYPAAGQGGFAPDPRTAPVGTPSLIGTPIIGTGKLPPQVNGRMNI